MASTLNLSLTDELKQFIYSCSGDGTLYSTPSEFVRDLIREKKQQMEAQVVRASILRGYEDVITGKTVEFKGSLRQMLDSGDA